MNKIISVIVIVIIAISILTGLGKQIAAALNASKRVEEQANRVTRLTEKNNQLKKQLVQAQTPDAIEKIARDQLNLSKPGETIVVIPDELITKVLEEAKPKEEPKIPNWQGWLKLFIH